MEENDKIYYTAADIDRYLRGKMTASEMHAMEKAALEDPFLADAIEGYGERMTLAGKEPGDDLDDLKIRLKNRIEPDKKTIALGGRWWRIAAMILLLAGIGTIIYRVVSTSSLQEKPILSKNETSIRDTIKQPGGEIKSLPADTTSLALNEKAEDNMPHAVLPSSQRSNLLKHKPADPSSMTRTIPLAAAPRSINDSVSQTQTYELDKEKSAMASMSKKKEEPVENKKDLKTLSKNEAVGYRRAADAEDFSLKQDAEPEIGFAEYNKYIEKNKKSDTSVNHPHGDVVVSFVVGTTGRLSNFKIEKSLSKSLDEEAIRLIKKGPAWKALTDRSAQVEFAIRF